MKTSSFQIYFKEMTCYMSRLEKNGKTFLKNYESNQNNNKTYMLVKRERKELARWGKK